MRNAAIRSCIHPPGPETRAAWRCIGLPVEFDHRDEVTWPVPITRSPTGLNGLQRLMAIQFMIRQLVAPGVSEPDRVSAREQLGYLVHDYSLRHVEPDCRWDVTHDTLLHLHQRLDELVTRHGVVETARKVHGLVRDRYALITHARRRRLKIVEAAQKSGEASGFRVIDCPHDDLVDLVQAVKEHLIGRYRHGRMLARLVDLLAQGLSFREAAPEMGLSKSALDRKKHSMLAVIRRVCLEEARQGPAEPLCPDNEWAALKAD